MLADPFMNDQNFLLSVLTLEELGATGNKVSLLSTTFQVFVMLHKVLLSSLCSSRLQYRVGSCCSCCMLPLCIDLA